MERYKEFFQPDPIPEPDHKAIADKGVSQLGIGLLRSMTNIVLGQPVKIASAPSDDPQKQ